MGFGVLRAAAELIRDTPRPEWMEELKVLGLAPPERLVWPIEGGHFGRGLKGRAPRFRVHRGVDVTAEVGTPVRVLADGLVAYADNGVRGYGNLLVVLHGGGEVSAYAHLSSIEVMTGAIVQAGDQVAHSGNTGLSRGPHLHFEWRERGEVSDPMRRFPTHQPRWMSDLFAARPLRARGSAKSH